MDWLGIGILVIGIAFAALVLLLIKPLNNLGNVLFSVQRTTDKLPHNIDLIIDRTKDTIQTSTETLSTVNNQIKELSPLFYIIGDVGRSTQKLSASLVDTTATMKTTTRDGKNFNNSHNLEGLYGVLTLGYYLAQRRKTGQL